MTTLDGWPSTGIVATTLWKVWLRGSMSMTETSREPILLTYARVPSGLMAKRPGISRTATRIGMTAWEAVSITATLPSSRATT